MTFHGLFQTGFKQLFAQYPHSAKEETSIFLCEAFNIDKATYLAQLHDELTDESAKNRFFELIQQRLTGKPVDYILGHTIFMGKKYNVSEHVLLPRPETEILVTVAIEHIRHLNHNPLVIVECGFGTGVISCELAQAFRNVSIHAYDVSRETLTCAQKNATLHHINNVHWYCEDFLSGRWKTQLPEGAHVVLVSNPPYIATADIATLDSTVQTYDPFIALDGGKDGLMFYRYFFKEISKHINSFICEIGYDQKDLIEELAVNNQVQVVFHQDYQGHDRVVLALAQP